MEDLDVTLGGARPFPILAIISRPRSGSSFLAHELSRRGIRPVTWSSSGLQGASQFNSKGYFEDVYLSLLNDQLCRLLTGQGRASFLSGVTLEMGASRHQSGNDRSGEWCGFDLDENTVEVPEDYSRNFSYYNGHEWDVWGLTRMGPGGKWHCAYSRSGLGNRDGVLAAMDQVRRRLSLGSHAPQFIKDPRLLVTAPRLLARLSVRLILLRRGRQETLRSMRSHYGPRLFDHEAFPDRNWCSNHFNYRVPPQSSDQYYAASELLLATLAESHESLELDVEKLDSDALDNVARWVTAPMAGSRGHFAEQ